jgi:hypothetical protein
MGGGSKCNSEKKTWSSEIRVADWKCGTCCFTEGGIEFYVFSDGQFDFNARSSVRDKSLNQIREGMEIKLQ